MLTVQQSLFDTCGSKPPGVWLGGGCFGTVWAHPDGDTVIKRCGSDDGTLAWLYWSLHSGCKLPGVPEVYSLALLAEEGYVVTMKRYKPLEWDTETIKPFNKIADNDPKGFGRRMWCYPEEREDDIYLPAQLAYLDAVKAARRTNHDEPGFAPWFDGFDDMHSGNIMYDTGKGELVITDPSSSSIDRDHLWMLLPQPSTFALEMQ